MARWLRRVVGRAWRRVVAMALLLLAGGVAVVAATDGPTWTEVGTACIGGSIVGLVFAVAQHTLDEQVRERQVAGDIRLLVASSPVLDGIGLAGADLSGAYLWRKHLVKAHLEGAHLDGVDLRESNLDSATLRGADLRRADLRGAQLRRADLDGADLTGARIDARGLNGTSFVGARLQGATFVGPGDATPLDGPRRCQAVVAGTATEFDDASGHVDISAAVLDGARLPGVRLPALRGSFVSARSIDATGAVLAGSDLSCADLRDAGLSAADLRGADLGGADLTGAVLAGSDLRGARLVGARLGGADLMGASVAGADLRGADLRGAYLTNVDVTVLDLTGAWLGPAPEHEDDGEDEPERQPEAAAGRGWRTVVVGTRDPALRRLARDVVVRLRARRRSLDAANRDLEGIIVHDGPSDVGDGGELGLPARLVERSWSFWWRPRVELRREDGVLVLAVHGTRRDRRGGGATRLPAGEAASATADQVAARVQHALAGPGPFRSPDELAALAGWLDDRDRPLRPALDEVLALNPRNPLALLLSAGLRTFSDAAEMAQAADEARMAWAASSAGVRRALAATHLSRSQCQLVHRTSVDSGLVLARARAAGDAALRWFESATPRSRTQRHRHLALRSKAEHVRSFAQHVTEDPDDLREGIDRYRAAIQRLERHRLPVSTTTRNNMAYCLMTLLGRFRAGPAAGYREAMDQLRMVLAYCGVVEDWPEDGPAGPRPDAGEAGTDGVVGVAELARRSAAGGGPPDAPRLRHRSLHLTFANLGNLYRLVKQFDQALACYGAALYCKPDYVEAMGERAWVHLERSDLDSAQADMARVLATTSGSDQQKARIVVGFVDALERVGRPRDQRPWIERARQLDPGYVRVDELAMHWKERFDDGDRLDEDGAAGALAPG